MRVGDGVCAAACLGFAICHLDRIMSLPLAGVLLPFPVIFIRFLRGQPERRVPRWR
ncbi:MAG: hypothetical protein ACPIOQ_45645 [Promethearchaeia archaeon]